MIDLAATEQTLALFVEGMAGRYLHIKATQEFSSRRLSIDLASANQTTDTLLLPDQLDAPSASAYRVLALEQLAYREFGTFGFSLAEMRSRITLPEPENSNAGRASDLIQFFYLCPQPALIAQWFAIAERTRVVARMERAYPGIVKHARAYRTHQLQALDLDLIETIDDLARMASLNHLGATPALLKSLDLTGLVAPILAQLATLSTTTTDVYHSAACAMSIASLIAPYLNEVPANLVISEAENETQEWMQREARLQNWEEDLGQLEQQALSIAMLDANDIEVQQTEDAEGGLRTTELDLKSIQNERDVLQRRIGMEKSAIRDALGDEKTNARSYRYDEWDHLHQRYLKHWCRLFEERLEPQGDEDILALKQAVDVWRHRVQQQLEQIKPLGYQRVRRVTDGDELDFNAIISARQDIRAGQTPDDRLYSRRQRVHRDVCAALLVDLSASTDDSVDIPEPVEYDEEGAPVNLRDPFDDDDPCHAPLVPPEPERRIIDVQREAVTVMAGALEQLGDSYGIYGFSGYGKDCVEYYVAKDLNQPFTSATLGAIAAMQPKRSTRMGPAIRHTTQKLANSGNALKVLLMISDGFPQDSDYGPERGDHKWGLEDSARALREAQEKGIETFCVTVDRSGHDYLKTMCPDARYMVIEEIEDLPEALSKVYSALTG
ncbi:MAG: VWA domain-containing protein [Proteobacteria bacterium]|nr:VWA domain-containing protein [Pseudomonadota bacterium]